MIKRCYECSHWRKGIATEIWGKCTRAVPNHSHWSNRGCHPVMGRDEYCGEFDGRGLGSEMYGYNKPSASVDKIMDLLEEK